MSHIDVQRWAEKGPRGMHPIALGDSSMPSIFTPLGGRPPIESRNNTISRIHRERAMLKRPSLASFVNGFVRFRLSPQFRVTRRRSDSCSRS